MRPNVARMYVRLSPDMFGLYYTLESKYSLIKHEMKTYRPWCDIACNAEAFYTNMLNRMPSERKKKSIHELNFMKKQMENG